MPPVLSVPAALGQAVWEGDGCLHVCCVQQLVCSVWHSYDCVRGNRAC
jgi:hypothetical protein